MIFCDQSCKCIIISQQISKIHNNFSRNQQNYGCKFQNKPGQNILNSSPMQKICAFTRKLYIINIIRNKICKFSPLFAKIHISLQMTFYKWSIFCLIYAIICRLFAKFMNLYLKPVLLYMAGIFKWAFFPYKYAIILPKIKNIHH